MLTNCPQISAEDGRSLLQSSMGSDHALIQEATGHVKMTMRQRDKEGRSSMSGTDHDNTQPQQSLTSKTTPGLVKKEPRSKETPAQQSNADHRSRSTTTFAKGESASSTAISKLQAYDDRPLFPLAPVSDFSWSTSAATPHRHPHVALPAHSLRLELSSSLSCKCQTAYHLSAAYLTFLRQKIRQSVIYRPMWEDPDA